MGSNFIVRIDDRLIHGQVITGWVKVLNLNNIIVANDKLVKDKYKIQVIKLAVPSDIHLEFLTIKNAAEMIKQGRWKNYQTILLVESPKDAYRLVKMGCRFSTINVGGLHYKEGRVQLTSNLAVDENDRRYLIELAKMGVQLEGRALPSDEAYNVIKILNTHNNKNGIL